MITFYPNIPYSIFRSATSNAIFFSYDDPGRPVNAVIDPSLHDKVLPALEPGERLLWAGRPDPRRIAWTKIRQTLFGAVFLLLSILVYLAFLPDTDLYFRAYSQPFSLRPVVIVAGFLLAFPGMLLPVLAYLRARRSVYAATDKRVLSLIRGCSVKAVRYEDMQVPLMDLRPDGSGDIHFNGKCRTDGTELQPQFPHFLGVGPAENVYQLLLGRMPGTDDGLTACGTVHDYLELLFQGKRTLNEDPTRE